MTTAFVLGNGISRQGLGLDQLTTLGKIYGCNALYRDFTPNVLVATDRAISEHIQNSGYAQTNDFYTRRPAPNTGAKQVPAEYHGYSSGPIAVAIAAKEQNNTIYLIGFDMGPTLGHGFNNLYADTEFYKTSKSLPTFTGNWIKQISRIARDYPYTKFVRVCGSTTAAIQVLEKIPNMQHLEMHVFLEQINISNKGS
jgi:hypothetical protein